jgi:hypothetical protein
MSKRGLVVAVIGFFRDRSQHFGAVPVVNRLTPSL